MIVLETAIHQMTVEFKLLQAKLYIKTFYSIYFWWEEAM